MIPWHRCYYLSEILSVAARNTGFYIKDLQSEIESFGNGSVTFFDLKDVEKNTPEYAPETISTVQNLRKLGIKQNEILVILDM